ncbi:MAG: ammonium transporter [Eubacteriales bacterium]|nr:ammonium transporter [Eubacteriales bacterium]
MELDVTVLTEQLDTLWMLVAAVLVFFMQAGFAMVEAGFTRAKNASNIIMKNLMDFAIGSFLFFVVGYGMMYGKDIAGLIGGSQFIMPSDAPVAILFQTVFCATAATIVSGAMAERTKFVSYVIYSAVISAIIYPIAGHWLWGGGWLYQLGMIDFAGSTLVHSVGGWAALVGAAMLGPRIGKYKADGTPNAIPGHNITIGALGVFILWFGWFGFNPGSTLALDVSIGHIAMTTNLSAALGAITVMTISWVKYGKPDVSMTLNGALGGLVAITAGCASVSMWGAIAIGVIAGFVIVFGVEFVERKLKIDDPVGAISVHGLCGVAGTLSVGLFATAEVGELTGMGQINGLFYGGGFGQLAVQAIGVVSYMAWTLATAFILFKIIKSTIGLRVSKEEEIMGLDLGEHGTEGYADFVLKM